MPEYRLDTSLDHDTWEALDSFTQGYIECAFWLSEGEDDDGYPTPMADAGFHDLAPEALEQMKADCAAFQEMARQDLNEVLSPVYAERQNYTEERAGMDFWLTRNGHGSGFWDRGFGDLRTDTVGGRLSRDAKSFGTCDLYLGDDGKVYVS